VVKEKETSRDGVAGDRTVTFFISPHRGRIAFLERQHIKFVPAFFFSTSFSKFVTMLASILSKVSPVISRAAAMQPSTLTITRDMATKTNKTAKLKAKLRASILEFGSEW
jgi:hypothetical protein